MIIILFLALVLSGCIDNDPWVRQLDQDPERRAALQQTLGPVLLQGMNQHLSHAQQPLQPIRPIYPAYPSNQYPYGCMSNGQYTSCY